ncbi:DUF4367 domain-containing protein [Gracilibacillus kekensis]|uniref:DUF4367 domain-containing protein n=1 Tax=Gracilibacillus kekensis TaxID=1027249 RepID=A0A1M7QIG9_9BACI|nr:DUF4367 domain-containing protein [Gracilibacillus kekensis]SHN30878.1 protein of unknown function [Gracilibacillus kekensis]
MTNKLNNWESWLKEDYQSPAPAHLSKEENWREIKASLTNTSSTKKRLFPKKSLLAVAVFALIIFGSVFASSNQIQAFDWFVKMFVTTDGDTTQISQTTTDGESPSSSDLPDLDKITTEEIEVERTEMSFDKAQEETNFYIAKPTFNPNNYQLKYVEVVSKDSEKNQVQLYYENGQSETVVLTQTFQPNDFASAKVVDNEDTNVKIVDLDGGEARFIEFKDNSKQLIWSTPQMNWLLEGKLPEKDMIKIAESIE